MNLNHKINKSSNQEFLKHLSSKKAKLLIKKILIKLIHRFGLLEELIPV